MGTLGNLFWGGIEKLPGKELLGEIRFEKK